VTGLVLVAAVAALAGGCMAILAIAVLEVRGGR
jgi:hypothetical protein